MAIHCQGNLLDCRAAAFLDLDVLCGCVAGCLEDFLELFFEDFFEAFDALIVITFLLCIMRYCNLRASFQQASYLL